MADVVPLHFRTPADLLGKVERDLERHRKALKDGTIERIADATFDLVVTAHSVRDWVWQTADVTDEERKHLKDRVCKFVAHMFPLNVIRDLANGSKHFELENDDADTIATTVSAMPVMVTTMDFEGLHVGGAETSRMAEVPPPFNVGDPDDLRRYCARRPFLHSKFVKVVTKDGTYLLENMIEVALGLWRRYPAG